MEFRSFESRSRFPPRFRAGAIGIRRFPESGGGVSGIPDGSAPKCAVLGRAAWNSPTSLVSFREIPDCGTLEVSKVPNFRTFEVSEFRKFRSFRLSEFLRSRLAPRFGDGAIGIRQFPEAGGGLFWIPTGSTRQKCVFFGQGDFRQLPESVFARFWVSRFSKFRDFEVSMFRTFRCF